MKEVIRAKNAPCPTTGPILKRGIFLPGSLLLLPDLSEQKPISN